jgi:hypothetical protein
VKTLKVIQLVPELNGGGVERGTLELGNYLSSLGHESIVVSNGGRLVEQLEQGGFNAHKGSHSQEKLKFFFSGKSLEEIICRGMP